MGRSLPAAAAAVALTACDRAPPPGIESLPLADAEAIYELRFNDKTVGEVFFALDVDEEGRYRIDAFTRPVGDALSAEGQEIVEYSEGRLLDGEVLPDQFGHSARAEEGVEGLTFSFDWQAETMVLDNGDRNETVDLPAATQDRLSYLLLARRLAIGGGERSLQIVGPQGAERATLSPLDRREIDVPAGRFSAAGVARRGSDDTPQRELWFADATVPLPLRVTQYHGDNQVDMLLTRYSVNDPR